MAQGIHAGNGRLDTALEGDCGRPIRRGARRGFPCTKPLGMGTNHKGEGPCQYHGGKTPRGAAHPNFKHGRFSKHWASVGERMQAAIEDLASDPEYLHLRKHIATLDFLFLEELQALEADMGGGGWDKARALIVDLRVAFSAGNVGGVQRSLKQLQSLADSGARRDKSLLRVQSLLRDRVTATRADQSRVESEKAYATVDQLKQIALVSATSVASQLDLFTRQVMALLTEPERLRVQVDFNVLKREALQGVSESFRRALVGQTEPEARFATIEAEVVPTRPSNGSGGTQAPEPGPGRPQGAQASHAVPIPGIS